MPVVRTRTLVFLKLIQGTRDDVTKKNRIDLTIDHTIVGFKQLACNDLPKIPQLMSAHPVRWEKPQEPPRPLFRSWAGVIVLGWTIPPSSSPCNIQTRASVQDPFICVRNTERSHVGFFQAIHHLPPFPCKYAATRIFVLSHSDRCRGKDPFTWAEMSTFGAGPRIGFCCGGFIFDVCSAFVEAATLMALSRGSTHHVNSTI